MKRVHFLSSGKKTDRNGISVDFAENVMQDIATSYDPAVHEAPLVIGHPKTDDPAWGWVKSIELAEDGAHAIPIQVDPVFAEMVESGKFKQRSCSVYLPDSPNNPKPGHYYLRHIGFLGATPPAIKGLKTTEFADSEEGVLFFEDYELRTVAGLFRRIRDFFVDQFGLEKADQVISSWDIDYLTERAAQPDDNRSVSYTEPSNKPAVTPPPKGGDPLKTPEQLAAEFAERESALSAQAAAIKTREEALQAKERASARQAHVDFVEGLVKSGQVLPVQREAFTEALVACGTAAPVEFSEGDKKVSKSPADALRDALKAMPKVVEFTEKAAPSGEGKDDLPQDPMAAGKELAKRAAEFVETEAKAGRTVTMMDAFAHIEKEAAQ